MSIQKSLEEILSIDLAVDNIEVIRLNLVTNNKLDNRNDKYTQIREEVRSLSKKVDNLINNINFENIIQTPPF